MKADMKVTDNKGALSPQDGDDTPLAFTHTIYISPHFSGDKSIKIFDLTDVVTAPYPSETFNEQTERLGQAKLEAHETATWIIHDPRFWRTTTLHPGHITEPAGREDTIIASWTPSRWSQGKNHIHFPSGSTHSSHDIIMERRQFISSRAEGFVLDSVQYFWRHDAYSRRQLTLWKVLRGGETVVARYKAPYRFPRTGGTLVVDTKEVDLVVGFMTCIAMLRKVRQNDA